MKRDVSLQVARNISFLRPVLSVWGMTHECFASSQRSNSA
jgi:hypothetical protein